MDLAFLLLEEATQPDPDVVIATAKEAGFDLSLSGSASDEPQMYEVSEGVTLMVMVVDAPHPDVPEMPSGPISPPQEQMLAAKAHAIVTLAGLEGEVVERDRVNAALAAGVVRATPTVAAMLGHGIMFYPADVFADLAVAAAQENQLPTELLVDVTVAREDEERMSFLTHGLARYQREEFYMTCPIEGEGALPFLFDLVRWMVYDPDKQLPTGETLGRTEDERIEIQRVPSPLGEGPEVIKLDLQE